MIRIVFTCTSTSLHFVFRITNPSRFPLLQKTWQQNCLLNKSQKLVENLYKYYLCHKEMFHYKIQDDMKNLELFFSFFLSLFQCFIYYSFTLFPIFALPNHYNSYFVSRVNSVKITNLLSKLITFHYWVHYNKRWVINNGPHITLE